MKTKQSGYALIEILIVLSIIVLFSGLSLAYFRGFDEQKKLDAEAKQLIDVLNLAQKKSTAADLSPNLNCSDFQGYRVNIQTTTSYALEFNCTGSYSTVQSYALRSGMTLSGIGTNILFKPLSAGTNLSNSITTTITSSTTGKCIKIQINPVGTVEELSNCP